MKLHIPLDQMTVAEKLEAIDVLWNDLLQNPEDIPSPPWHIQILEERQAMIDAGEAKFYDLDEAFERIRNRTA